jgi:hypothetical protein
MSFRINRKLNYTISPPSSVSSYWDLSGSDICNNNLGNVIIGTSKVRIGTNVGLNNQGENSIAIGNTTATTNQGENSIAIGNTTASCNQGCNNIAIGRLAGDSIQKQFGVSIGFVAGRTNQGTNCIAVGYFAGNLDQSANSIAIGSGAAQSTQGFQSIAIGQRAGQLSQGVECIAIGSRSGRSNQAKGSISIGNSAGSNNQGSFSIAIGNLAGVSSLPPHAIILDASATSISLATQQGFYVRPIRNIDDATQQCLTYDLTTREIIRNTNAAKTFVIDHPRDDDRYLVHACLEGPEAGVYYRGEGKITNGESTEILLPSYAKEFDNFTIQITPIELINKFGATRVKDGKFKVIGENGEFYWLVHGKRSNINVEPNKNKIEVKGEGPYKYIL